MRKTLKPPLFARGKRDRYETSLNVPHGRMNQIIAFQERGATIREIAAAFHCPVEEVRRDIERWLRRD